MRNVLIVCALTSWLSACSAQHAPSAPAGSGGSSGRGDAGKSAAGGGSGGALSSAGDDACETASDCGYGEIRNEILTKTDCVCLFGCPFLALNKATVTRRQAQYQHLCDPRVDGKGQSCPIDDCVTLPDPSCVDHKCVATKSR